MNPPVSFDRAGAKAAGYTDAEIDAHLASQAQPATPAESTSVKPRKQEVATAKTPTSFGGDVVGMTRSFMDKATFGQYPRMVGALSSLTGADSKAEAERLAGYIAEYRKRNPSKAEVAGIAGSVAPYFAAAPAAIASRLGSVPTIAKSMQTAARGYKAARSLPGASKLLPVSATTAGQIAGVEGLRGASEAEEGESKIAAALKSATTGLPFGRLGEVAGTYAAGKFGPTISKMAAKSEDKAREAGAIMNAFKELGTLEVTPALAKLYERSKPLREAVDEAAESLGLPSTDPKVLAEAYSALTEKASPVFKQTILSPFLQAIDEAAAPLVAGVEGMPRFSKGVRDYAKAKKVTEAIQAGKATGSYLQSGAGDAVNVGPEVLSGRMGRSFVSDAERQAAAQALIASIGERNAKVPTTLRGGLFELGRMALTGGPRGVGAITDLAAELGGGSRGQKIAQRAGSAFGASR